jgi:hypothetical protein
MTDNMTYGKEITYGKDITYGKEITYGELLEIERGLNPITKTEMNADPPMEFVLTVDGKRMKWKNMYVFNNEENKDEDETIVVFSVGCDFEARTENNGYEGSLTLQPVNPLDPLENTFILEDSDDGLEMLEGIEIETGENWETKEIFTHELSNKINNILRKNTQQIIVQVYK